jgi:uncharacterized protein
MKKRLFFIILFLVIIAAFFLTERFFGVVFVKDRIFFAQKASSIEKREKGLSERNNLCKNCSMLFVFEKSGEYPFWMKGMRFNLDIIWIEKNRIVHIEKNIPYSDSDKKIFNPKIEADKVLEINAGLADEYKLKEGDEVNIY